MARSKSKKNHISVQEIEQAVEKQTVAARLTQYEIEERRRNVERLRLRGLSIQAISKIVKVETWTVTNDIKAIKERNIKEVTEFNQNTAISDVLSRFSEIEERAWAEYSSADTARDRVKALDLLRVLQNDKVKTFKDVGLVHNEKETTKVAVMHTLDWTPELKESVIKTLLYQGLQELPAPTMDIIDVDVMDEDEFEENE